MTTKIQEAKLLSS